MKKLISYRTIRTYLENLRLKGKRKKDVDFIGNNTFSWLL